MRAKRPELPLVLGLGLLVGACQDSSQSPPARPEPRQEKDAPGGSMLEPLDLVYVCGNKFLATNSTPRTAQVTYRVVGTDETGSLTLPHGTEEDPGYSETELETVRRGVVELYVDEQRVARRRNEGSACGAAPVRVAAVVGSGPGTGSWSAPFPWPVVAVHLNLMPNGRVLSWGLEGEPQVWNPATGDFTPVASPAELFCAGESFLSDGRLLVSGGHISTDHGIPNNTIFSPGTESWTSSTPMRRGRWYPTNTTLASGSVVILAGKDEAGVAVAEPEVWSSSGVRVLSTANLVLPYYPRTFLAPNGKVFYAGEQQTTRYLNTSGTGSWTKVGSRLYGVRYYGAAVMYDVGKVLYVGGGRTTNTAEIIDLNAAAPVWRWTGSMAYARRYLNATVLPTGEVLVTGGTSSATTRDVTQAVRAAELWNPSTGIWTTMASNAVRRSYHSTSILLPDGRVLHSGSGDADEMPDERNAELFSPPYLLKGPRPVISSAPSEIGYGTTFSVATPQADDIDKVSLIRLGAATHAFDMNQRFQWLSFTHEAGALTISTPANSNIAPPGHYMLFLLDRNGVPSVAEIVRVYAAAAGPPPNSPPVAAFLMGCSGFACTFADRSTDVDGNLSSWSWDFGDGSGSSARDPNHTYGANGTYTVTLTAGDGQGATSSASKQVSVPGPEFPINLSATGQADATKHYMTLTWTGAQGPTVYIYRNGVVVSSTANDGTQTLTRTFQGSATYLLKVCEAGTTICSNEVTLEIGGTSPGNTPPTADFTSSCGGLSCTFTDRSTDGDGSVAAWQWAFGDGGTSTARNPSRTYAAAGSYNVTLTATDNQGAANSKSATVTVTASAGITLTASGREDASNQYMDLVWSGMTGTRTDVYRNGVLHVNTLNDGKQTIVKYNYTGPATYLIKVCKEGTTICSNQVSLVFQ